jgi:hypothetical protein
MPFQDFRPDPGSIFVERKWQGLFWSAAIDRRFGIFGFWSAPTCRRFGIFGFWSAAIYRRFGIPGLCRLIGVLQKSKSGNKLPHSKLKRNSI